jgi:hypothetical protein
MHVLAVIDVIAFGHGVHMMAGVNRKTVTTPSMGNPLAVIPEAAFLAYLVCRNDTWLEAFAPDTDTLLDFLSTHLPAGETS